MQKPKVILELSQHRGENCIFLRFEKDFNLIGEVRKIPGVKFSKTNACWFIVNGKSALSSIFHTLRDKGWVDYSTLRNASSNEKILTYKRECPAEYNEQLGRTRYSGSTKKIYINYFTQFINYFPASPVDEISDDQVNQYMQHLLAGKKFLPPPKTRRSMPLNSIMRKYGSVSAKYMHWSVP